MRHLALALAAAAGVLVAPAADAAPGPGLNCSFVPLQLDTSPTYRTGYLTGGPYTVIGASMTLRCSIQLGTSDPKAPDEVSVSDSGTVAFVEPHEVSFFTGGQQAYLCTELSWYPVMIDPPTGNSGRAAPPCKPI